MKPLLFSFLLLIYFTRTDASGFEFTGNCKAAYEEMLQLNFVKTKNLLNEEINSNPENAAVYYIENYTDFLKAFISEEDGDYFSVKNNLDRRIETIEKKAGNSPWTKMAKGEMLLQLAVLKLKRKEYLSAGYYIRKSYKLLEANQNQFPNFLPNLKSLGFLHAVIGAVPENYKWLSNLVGMHGTISQGGDELSRLLNYLSDHKELSFLKSETGLLKIFIATHFEKDFVAALALLETTKSNSLLNSPILVFMEANTLMVSGKPNEALVIIKTYQPSKSQYPLYYLDYLQGILKLNTLDFDAARNFKEFTEGFKGKSFIKSAYQKLAWIALLKNDTSGYMKYLDIVKIIADDFTDEDKQALKEATSGERPNIYLLRSRLLFDGGNYNEALAELTGKPAGYFSKYKDQLEFTYRLARIFDKKGQTDKAIQYYTTTFENGKRTTWYFAANAALNNGLLYENKGDTSNAAIWYKKCLELRDHEYQNSIDQKAEAGMNRIND